MPWFFLAVSVLLLVVVSWGFRTQSSSGGEEEPQRILGSRVVLREIDWVGANPPEKVYGTIESYESGNYKLRFDSPVNIDGQLESFARFSARHAGHPVSKVGRLGLLAVQGAFESGAPFMSSINLA